MANHDWIVDNLIYIIAYADKEGLSEVSSALFRALPEVASHLSPRELPIEASLSFKPRLVVS